MLGGCYSQRAHVPANRVVCVKTVKTSPSRRLARRAVTVHRDALTRARCAATVAATASIFHVHVARRCTDATVARQKRRGLRADYRSADAPAFPIYTVPIIPGSRNSRFALESHNPLEPRLLPRSTKSEFLSPFERAVVNVRYTSHYFSRCAFALSRQSSRNSPRFNVTLT